MACDLEGAKASMRRWCGDHLLSLVVENRGTTKHTEYTETRHNRARILFRVFGVFRGQKTSELGDNRTGPLSPASQNLQLDVDLDLASLYYWFNTVVQRGSQMQIHIQTQGGVPIYVQVMQQIKYLVASGRLQPGDELPSIRTLAEQLIVNPNTIARAYRELESAGVVEKRRTAGTYVAETGSPLARKERLKLLNQRIDQLLVEAFQMGFELDEVLKLVQQSQLNSQQTKKGQPRHE